MSAHVNFVHPAIPLSTIVILIITDTLISIAYRPIIKGIVHSTGVPSSDVGTNLPSPVGRLL